MKIINAFIWRHLKLNKKKTAIVTGSIFFATMLLTILLTLFDWSYGVMKELVIRRDGAWQARFYGLTDEQYQELKRLKEVKWAEAEENEKGEFNVDITLNTINKSIFRTTQVMGENLGMVGLKEQGRGGELLPNGDAARYDVSYHMELLEFYGITEGKTMKLSIKMMFSLAAAASMVVCAIFIRNAFEISYIEKRKYLGLLACMNAARWQKRWFILGEGLVLGIISIPMGILTGVLTSWPLIAALSAKLKEKIGISQIPEYSLHLKVVLAVLILGTAMIIFASLMPVIKAGRMSAKDMICDYGSEQYRNVHLHQLQSSRRMGLSLAIRNLQFHLGRTLMLAGLVAVVIIFALNGYVYAGLQRGNYSLQDRREREEGDVWVKIHSEDGMIGEKICEEISRMEGIHSAKYIRELPLLGILIDSSYVKDDKKEFRVYGDGIDNPVELKDIEEVKGVQYGFNAEILALEDELFSSYADETETDNNFMEHADYPVIISDYLPVKLKGNSKPSYQSVLDINSPQMMTIRYGEYADMLLSKKNVFVSGIHSIELQVLCSTDKVPPVPKRPEELEGQINEYIQYADANLKIYMPLSKFQEFIEEEEIISTYKDTPAEERADTGVIYNEDKDILNYIYIDKSDQMSDDMLKKKLNVIMKEYGIYQQKAEEISAMEEENMWVYNSVELERQQAVWNPSEWLKEIFFSVSIILVLAFSVSCLLNYVMTSTITRKREFAVLKSVGMHKNALKKMLVYEILIQMGAGTVIGISVGIGFNIYQFYMFSQSTAIEAVIPWKFLAGEVGILAVLMILITVYAMKRVERFNVIETIKNEND